MYYNYNDTTTILLLYYKVSISSKCFILLLTSAYFSCGLTSFGGLRFIFS